MCTKKKTSFFYLIILFCGINSINVNAQETKNENSTAGKNISWEEVKLAEQIPGATLSTISTEELIQSYLDSRYPGYLLRYNDIQYAFEHACNDYNGLRELLIGVPDGAFNFPLDVYAGYVSYSQGSDSIIIDSLVYLTFKPGTRQIVNEKTLQPTALKKIRPDLDNKISLNFYKELIVIFKKYGMFYIKRGGKTFAPSDTISHYIKSRRGRQVLTKSFNFNKSLLIKFNKKFDIQKFAQDLRKIKGISYARPNEIVKEFAQPNDSDYLLYQQTYLGSQIMNFEGAWNNVKGG